MRFRGARLPIFLLLFSAIAYSGEDLPSYPQDKAIDATLYAATVKNGTEGSTQAFPLSNPNWYLEGICQQFRKHQLSPQTESEPEPDPRETLLQAGYLPQKDSIRTENQGRIWPKLSVVGGKLILKSYQQFKNFEVFCPPGATAKRIRQPLNCGNSTFTGVVYPGGASFGGSDFGISPVGVPHYGPMPRISPDIQKTCIPSLDSPARYGSNSCVELGEWIGQDAEIAMPAVAAKGALVFSGNLKQVVRISGQVDQMQGADIGIQNIEVQLSLEDAHEALSTFFEQGLNGSPLPAEARAQLVTRFNEQARSSNSPAQFLKKKDPAGFSSIQKMLKEAENTAPKKSASEIETGLSDEKLHLRSQALGALLQSLMKP